MAYKAWFEMAEKKAKEKADLSWPPHHIQWERCYQRELWREYLARVAPGS